MDEHERDALEVDMTVDITTTGRKTGKPRRIEIWSHHFDGRTILTGSPGRRSWYANLVANPDFTYHLKGAVQADLSAVARPMIGKSDRRAILGRLRELSKFRQEQGMQDLESWVDGSALVEVTFKT
jgi:deazaflavin-dependent oxidoreductase (nitroreductase family)